MIELLYCTNSIRKLLFQVKDILGEMYEKKFDCNFLFDHAYDINVMCINKGYEENRL